MIRKKLLFTFLSLAFLATSVFFWIYWRAVFGSGVSLQSALIALIMSSFLVSLFNLLVLISDPRKLALLGLASVGLAAIVLFTNNLFFFLGLLSLFLIFLISFRTARGNKKRFKTFSPLDITSSRTALSGFFLALAFFFTASKSTEGTGLRLDIPDDLFLNLTKATLKLVEGSISKDPASAENLFNQEVPRLRQSLQDQGIEDENEISLQIEKARRVFPSQVTDDTLLSLKKTFEEGINTYLLGYQPFAPVFFFLSFLFSWGLVIPILEPMTNIQTLIFFNLLLRLKFINLAKKMEEVQVLEF